MSWFGFLPEADHEIRIQVKAYLGKWNKEGKGANKGKLPLATGVFDLPREILGAQAKHISESSHSRIEKFEYSPTNFHQTLVPGRSCWGGQSRQSSDGRKNSQEKKRRCWHLGIRQCKVVEVRGCGRERNRQLALSNTMWFFLNKPFIWTNFRLTEVFAKKNCRVPVCSLPISP